MPSFNTRQDEGTMREYYAKRAQYYERVYTKTERQHDLATLKTALPAYFAGRDVLDNSLVQTSNLPITRTDSEGNTYQNRQLDDGSVHEVLKNFPGKAQAFSLIAKDARAMEWMDYEHYWVLSYLLK